MVPEENTLAKNKLNITPTPSTSLKSEEVFYEQQEFFSQKHAYYSNVTQLIHAALKSQSCFILICRDYFFLTVCSVNFIFN